MDLLTTFIYEISEALQKSEEEGLTSLRTPWTPPGN